MKTHGFDAVSFVSGLIIALVGLLFLIPADATDIIDLVAGLDQWFWPALFLGLGAAVLIPALLSRDREDGDQAG